MLCITFLHLKMNLNCAVHERAKQSLLHAWWFEEAVVDRITICSHTVKSLGMAELDICITLKLSL